MKRISLVVVCCFFLLGVKAQSGEHPLLLTEKGKISIKSAKGFETIPSSGFDTLPVMAGRQVYFARNDVQNRGMLMRYDLKSHATVNLFQTTDTPAHFPKGKIVQLKIDEHSGKLYYSLKTREEKGIPIYFTMVYDISQNKIVSYQDGMVEHIDKEGRHTIVYYDIDPAGAYRLKNIFTAEGDLLQSFEKDYPDPSVFK